MEIEELAFALKSNGIEISDGIQLYGNKATILKDGYYNIDVSFKDECILKLNGFPVIQNSSIPAGITTIWNNHCDENGKRLKYVKGDVVEFVGYESFGIKQIPEYTEVVETKKVVYAVIEKLGPDNSPSFPTLKKAIEYINSKDDGIERWVQAVDVSI